jgi:hypothetical protein
MLLSSTNISSRRVCVVNHSFLRRQSANNKKEASATGAAQSRKPPCNRVGDMDLQICTVLQRNMFTFHFTDRTSGQKKPLDTHTFTSRFPSSKGPSKINCACLIKTLYKVHLYVKIILASPNTTCKTLENSPSFAGF